MIDRSAGLFRLPRGVARGRGKVGHELMGSGLPEVLCAEPGLPQERLHRSCGRGKFARP